MAARKGSKKKTKLEDLPGLADARAPLDWSHFLASAQPVLKELHKDLLARAKDSPAVTEALKARHAAEKAAKRTAEAFPQWQQHFIAQVAAAWLLSCVFARTLEDRGLLGSARIAGPGAVDSQKLFFEMAPSLTERDYLLLVFRELARFPAAKDLFDARHNPVWLLTPSAAAAKKLLALFRTPSAEQPAFRFGQRDTAFLGWLYQDIDEDVRERYALLQTPRFVEEFILDRTLEPAIEKFGLDDTTVIDPTCGSGHFLLGSFERLVEHRLRKEPGLDVRKAAAKALDAVFGADINPYAVAISRFRLTLAFLERGGFERLADAPALPLHLVVADSLLHNPHLQQADLSSVAQAGQHQSWWAGGLYALENEAAARDVLFRKYAAVVGNPPYITVKDAALRERYRERYPRSAAGKYSVAAPFTERFFQLGRVGGRVGMITANSFMKREFGKKLIEEYLPTVNLDVVVNTSGAYIPGHGTPTVLLFGSAEEPQGSDVLTVLASRGEPSTPEDASQGLVWRSIAEHWGDVGFENDYITVSRTGRQALAAHPWSLAGGGAAALKDLIESRASRRLGDLVDAIGRTTHTGEDEIYFVSAGAVRRIAATGNCAVPLVRGEQVRDWSITADEMSLLPYDERGGMRDLTPAEAHYYWRYRSVLRRRKDFGNYIEDRGLRWYEHSMFFAKRFVAPLGIGFAFVATHNQFVLDRGGKVFNRSAPIIKLPESATEDDHLALLAYLNSSTACFWMKQVSYPKGGDQMGDGGRLSATPWQDRFEFAGTALQQLPLPPKLDTLLPFGRQLDQLASECAAIDSTLLLQRIRETTTAANATLELERWTTKLAQLRRRMVALQEALDFAVYRLFGLHDDTDLCLADDEERCGHRAFEHARCASDVPLGPDEVWFRRGGYERPDGVSPSPLVRRRMAAVAADRYLKLLESMDYKRPWRFSNPTEDLAKHLPRVLYGKVEAIVAQSTAPMTRRALAAAVGERFASDWPKLAVVTDAPDAFTATAALMTTGENVPYAAAWTFTPAGIEKRAQWERTWDLQRREDAGEKVGTIPVPPKYDQKDFRSPEYWRLRGKLDVPKERFISYPGCESDEDGEPVYGWAGWDHEQRAKALATLYYDRKQNEGWEKERLTPMLAGLLELLPWLKQWHDEPSENYGNDSPASYYEGFLDAECAAFGLTHDDLRGWRPPEKARGGKKKVAGKKKKAVAEAAE